MANALGTLFSDIANAIRGKTGDTGTMKPAEFPAAITGISVGSGGGESSDLVKYVTFMNGDKELYRMPVLVGDDCKDPISHGNISTPTKGSTAQYSYTYYGWGASDGGASNSDILKNITENKTVYAIYTAATRYYTITYYEEDGTTVLNTQSIAYGRVPSYVPEKEGFDFSEWTPTPVAVTGDASYTAVWEERIIFASGQEITNTWEQVFSYTDRGLHTAKYLPGSYKYLDINGTTYKAEVAATETDERTDGLGKAAITWIIDEIVGNSVYNQQSAVLESAAIEAFPKNGNYWKTTDSAQGKWIISMPNGGTLNIGVSIAGRNYGGSNAIYWSKGKVSVKGVEQFNKNGSGTTASPTTVTIPVNCEAGEQIEVTASFTNPVLASAKDYMQIYFSSESEFVYEYYLTDQPAVYQKGTGTAGGWEYSYLRNYVRNEILPGFPENVRSRMITVNKDSGVVSDEIWVPSYEEVCYAAEDQSTYAALYPDANSRKKGANWFLRDPYMTNYAAYIDTTGIRNYVSPTTENGVVVGFCTW